MSSDILLLLKDVDFLVERQEQHQTFFYVVTFLSLLIHIICIHHETRHTR